MTAANRQLHVAGLEPYYGGSHAAFVDTLERHSRHRITLATLPARKWKWRMRGAALWFTRDGRGWLAVHDRDPYDVILANDMLAVADLRALLPAAMQRIPIVCYFHENQLTYPLPDEADRDFQYGMTNITSCLAAAAVWFNSHYHRDAFLEAAGILLAKMPDFVPERIIEEIQSKSAVMYPPVDVPQRDTNGDTGLKPTRARPVTFLWPHRWEYDKNPDPFFHALLHLHEQGRDFRLVLVGEQFRTASPVFAEMLRKLETHITHAGFIPDRQAYLELLAGCDVVVSTAVQENFGIAVLEAIFAGCRPLLPDRLAYPELIPKAFHPRCLYADDGALRQQLKQLTEGKGILTDADHARLVEDLAARVAVENAQPRIDDELAHVAATAGLR